MENSLLIFTRESHQQVSKELLKLIEFGACVNLTTALLFLLAYVEALLELSLLPLVLYNIHQIYLVTRELKQGLFCVNLRSTYNGFILIQQISDCLAKVSLIVHTLLGQYPYATMLGLALPCLANYCYRDPNYHPFQHFLHTLKAPFYFMVWASIVLHILDYFTSLTIPLIAVWVPVFIYLGIISFISCLFLIILIFMLVFRITISGFKNGIQPIFMAFSFLSVSSASIFYSISLTIYFESRSYEDLVLGTIVFMMTSFVILTALILIRRSFKLWLLEALEYNAVNTDETCIQLPPKLPTAFKRISEEFYVPITNKLFKKKNFQKTKSVSRPQSEEDEDLSPYGARSKESEPRIASFIDSEPAQDLCSICFENQSDAVIVPCGHGGICYQCTRTIGERCHICREVIQRSLMIKQNSETAYVSS